MKKIFLIGLINLSVFGFGQKLYTKINDSKVNKERLEVAKNFIDQYIGKCKDKDYSELKDFILSKRIEKDLYKDREKNCPNAENVKVLRFNSAYLMDYAKDDDPVELFIFDINHEKEPALKYISTWVYHDKNVIGGIWISKEKPLYKKRR